MKRMIGMMAILVLIGSLAVGCADYMYAPVPSTEGFGRSGGY